MRRPPRIHCRECGKELGRGWASAPLCADCAKGSDSGCLCKFPVWNDECPIHHAYNPYDIPF